jgi:hypothetical protein
LRQQMEQSQSAGKRGALSCLVYELLLNSSCCFLHFTGYLTHDFSFSPGAKHAEVLA